MPRSPTWEDGRGDPVPGLCRPRRACVESTGSDSWWRTTPSALKPSAWGTGSRRLARSRCLWRRSWWQQASHRLLGRSATAPRARATDGKACTSVTARRSLTGRLTPPSPPGHRRCPRSRRAARQAADVAAVTICWRPCSRRPPRNACRRPPRLPEHDLPAHHLLSAPTIVLDGDVGERRKCSVILGSSNSSTRY